ncbi:MAG: hypothetical protein HRU20_22680 [Pseudomonadales bacterium]|nr:hypothetical protein [Pseudomonadales bacterium]
MKNRSKSVYHPQLIIYSLNVLAWLLLLSPPLFESAAYALILACISFIPCTILFGGIAYFLDAEAQGEKPFIIQSSNRVI